MCVQFARPRFRLGRDGKYKLFKTRIKCTKIVNFFCFLFHIFEEPCDVKSHKEFHTLKKKTYIYVKCIKKFTKKNEIKFVDFLHTPSVFPSLHLHVSYTYICRVSLLVWMCLFTIGMSFPFFIIFFYINFILYMMFMTQLYNEDNF